MLLLKNPVCIGLFLLVNCQQILADKKLLSSATNHSQLSLIPNKSFLVDIIVIITDFKVYFNIGYLLKLKKSRKNQETLTDKFRSLGVDFLIHLRA